MKKMPDTSSGYSDRSETFLGIGLYTVTEASRLTGVSPSRIRRWVAGYDYTYRGKTRHSESVWSPQVPEVDGRVGLGFLDLIEVQFICALRDRGASWKTIRQAAESARKEFKSAHPFATRRFLIRTDGKKFFGHVIAGRRGRKLMDLATREFVMENLVSQSFVKSLDFDHGQVARWWPMGRDRLVVIDPKRSFGQPIVMEKGVPTLVLADAYKAENSIKSVALWYNLSENSVKDAVEYEQQLAA